MAVRFIKKVTEVVRSKSWQQQRGTHHEVTMATTSLSINKDKHEDRSLQPGSHWRHVQRGTRYEILTTAGSKVDENESLMVVYQGLDDGGKVWVRPVNRFLERTSSTTWRFEKIKVATEVDEESFNLCWCFRRLFGEPEKRQIVIQVPCGYDPSSDEAQRGKETK